MINEHIREISLSKPFKIAYIEPSICSPFQDQHDVNASLQMRQLIDMADPTIQSAVKALADGPKKARALAKALGADRSLISVFMRKHAEHFIQDHDYRWGLRELVITLPNSWVSSRILDSALPLDPCPLLSPEKCIRFIFSEKTKLMLSALASLLSLLNQMEQSGYYVIIDVTNSQESKSYLQRMEFFRLMQSNAIVIPQESATEVAGAFYHTSDRLVEFHPVNVNDPDHGLDLSKRLANCFIELFPESKYTPALTIFSELIGNIFLHSRTEIDGFVAMQSYKKGRRPHVQIVVSDSGRGLTSTLLDNFDHNYPDRNDIYQLASPQKEAALLKEAFLNPGFSRLGAKGGRGLGLCNSRDSASRIWESGSGKVTISIREERQSFSFDFENGRIVGDPEIRLNLAIIRGTQICLTINLS